MVSYPSTVHHEEELGDTYSWNFRMGYAYYYLDQEGRALRHFETALELHPGDDPKLNTRQDMEEMCIRDSNRSLIQNKEREVPTWEHGA